MEKRPTLWAFSFFVVGAAGFELATLCSQSRCATRLRYAPTEAADCTRAGTRFRADQRFWY